MLTKNGKIQCDGCGAFIGYADLEAGKATHVYALPDSEVSRETFESECAKCRGISAIPSADRKEVL